ncbi:MAG: four helix bundle protein [Saprospiraceae bacterium]|nr:four helix bundle protein [Saprospiraceae bacterium]
MAKEAFKKIEEIEAWNKARVVAKLIWEVSSEGTFAKDFSLKDQINRAAGSVMDNIAEGFGRGGNKEFSNFLSIARGSAQEVKSQIYRTYDRNHLDEATFKKLLELSVQSIISVHSLFNTVNTSDYDGSKFKDRR